jgi:hypothetical protein
MSKINLVTLSAEQRRILNAVAAGSKLVHHDYHNHFRLDGQEISREDAQFLRENGLVTGMCSLSGKSAIITEKGQLAL